MKYDAQTAVARDGDRFLERYLSIETSSGDAAALDRLVVELEQVHGGLSARTTIVATDGGSHLVAEFVGRGDAADGEPVAQLAHSEFERIALLRGRLSSDPFPRGLDP